MPGARGDARAPRGPRRPRGPAPSIPTSGSLSGVAGRKPVQVRSASSRGSAGRYSAARAQHAREERAVERGVPAHELARRADQQLAGLARLDVDRHRLARQRVRALQVAELDDLVAQEAGVAIGDHEVALPRDDREPRRQARRFGDPRRSRRGRPRATRPPQRTRPGSRVSARTPSSHAGARALAPARERSAPPPAGTRRGRRHAQRAREPRAQLGLGVAERRERRGSPRPRRGPR